MEHLKADEAGGTIEIEVDSGGKFECFLLQITDLGLGGFSRDDCRPQINMSSIRPPVLCTSH
jgi:hypothetical protein